MPQMLLKTLGALLLILLIASSILFPKLNTNLQWLIYALMAAFIATQLFKRLSSEKKISLSNLLWPEKNRHAKILVVDDNEANRRIISEMLGRLSLNCQEAETGKQALLAHKKYQFELIFLDINMQDMNGFEVVKTIRQSESNQRIPIVAISGHHELSKRLETLSVGYDDFLTKPVNLERLKEALNRWLPTEDKLKLETPAMPAQETDSTLETQSSNTNSDKLADHLIPKKYQPEPSQSGPKNKTAMVVDIEQSLNYSHNNSELAKDMLVMLIMMVSKEKDRIAQFHQQKSWEALSHLVHKLNGGCCYCGVPQLQAKVELIDKALQKEDYQTLDQNFSAMMDAMSQLIAWHDEHDLNIIFETD